MINPHRRPHRAGFTLVEALVAGSIFALVILAAYAALSRDATLSRSSLGISVAEMRAQQMLIAVEREVAGARGASPSTTATIALSAAGTAELRVASTLGFPDRGLLLVDRGVAGIERIGYDALGPGTGSFVGLARAQQCTNASSHPAGAEVLWAALAETIVLPASPPANLYDGRALEPGGPVWFRGDGTGFSYRVPTDPAGGGAVLVDGEITWGATVEGAPTLDGWAALVYVPGGEIREAATGDDLNGDGDAEDVFDVGRIRRRTWDSSDPATPASDLGLGPNVVLQERCDWGGDLDADGFDDPIFLWDGATRRLHVRLFVLGRSVADLPIVRRVESVIFLRNDPQG